MGSLQAVGVSTAAAAEFKPKLIRQKTVESRMYVFSAWLT
ncbi:hypothetical protein GNIT_1379 [Glaciecola nitratireducens FR1064]|uniref:Uncharacterized protein n=1 Tax=Glaciecola nitratireducens (strain JCM 12485 / KCTC 12276 / FR1064) TaxID=1085623 RepID=G4QGH8_GLANF|nr:hypothetical protein GNIT_1379 [Glaciecola nitratireducens FR1064]